MRTLVDLGTRVAVIDWTEKYNFDEADIARAKDLMASDTNPELTEELGALKAKTVGPTLHLSSIAFMSDAPQGNSVSGAEYLRIQLTIQALQEKLKGKTKSLKEVLPVSEALTVAKEKPEEECGQAN